MGKANSPKSVKRGTSDDLDILREIIVADRYLFEKVLDHIRRAKSSQDLGIIKEMASKKIEASERQAINKKK